jgi:hypothetical protein
MSIPPRVVFKGNTELANYHYKIGLVHLSILKESMKFRSLQQLRITNTLADGTVIQCSSVFGVDQLIITSPFVNPDAEQPKENLYEDSFVAFNTPEFGGAWDLLTDKEIKNYSYIASDGGVVKGDWRNGSWDPTYLAWCYLFSLSSFTYNTAYKKQKDGSDIPETSLSIYRSKMLFHTRYQAVSDRFYLLKSETILLYVNGKVKYADSGDASCFFLRDDGGVEIIIFNHAIASVSAYYYIVHRKFNKKGEMIGSQDVYTSSTVWVPFVRNDYTIAYDGTSYYLNINSFPVVDWGTTPVINDEIKLYDYDPLTREVVSYTSQATSTNHYSIANFTGEIATAEPPLCIPEHPHPGDVVIDCYTSLTNGTVLTGQVVAVGSSTCLSNEAMTECTPCVIYNKYVNGYTQTNKIVRPWTDLFSFYDWVNKKWHYYDYICRESHSNFHKNYASPYWYVYADVLTEILLYDQDGLLYTASDLTNDFLVTRYSQQPESSILFISDLGNHVGQTPRPIAPSPTATGGTLYYYLSMKQIPKFESIQYSLGAYRHHYSTDDPNYPIVDRFYQEYKNIDSISYSAKKDIGNGLQDDTVLPQTERRWCGNLSSIRTLKIKREL